MNKKLITSYLAAVGLYKPLRKLYNYFGRHNKTTEILFNNNKIIFYTPTFYLDEYVKNLAGETNVLNEFLSRLNTSDTFWDVGANIGLYSMIVSKTRICNNKIFAFEPENEAFKLIQKNISGNNLKNIFPLNFALGNTNGKKTIYSSDTPNFGAHSFVQRTDYKLKKKGKTVNVLTADSAIEQNIAEVPTAIKIDVEGAEILVLNGMKGLLKNRALRIILCEVHNNLLPMFGSSGKEITDLILSHGFRIDYNSKRKEQNHIIFMR